MRITVDASGVIQGTYRDTTGGPVRPVAGAVAQNGTVWLDIGGMNELRLNGTFRDGHLQALADVPGPDVYTLESTSVTRS